MRTAPLNKSNAILEENEQAISHIVHELRTQLNAIVGFTGTLLMKFPGPLNTEQEKQLNTIQTSAKKLLSLIDDLLALTTVPKENTVVDEG